MTFGLSNAVSHVFIPPLEVNISPSWNFVKIVLIPLFSERISWSEWVFFCVFVDIFGLKCRMILIFYWRKELGWRHFLNTLKMVVKCIENFLQAFDKKVSPQKWGFWQTTPTHFWAGFFKNQVFFAFPCI